MQTPKRLVESAAFVEMTLGHKLIAWFVLALFVVPLLAVLIAPKILRWRAEQASHPPTLAETPAGRDKTAE